MRLQRLSGHGSAAAFVSAGALTVTFAIEQVENVNGYAPLALAKVAFVGFFITLWLWLGALNVILFDLDRRERPATNTFWLQAARVLALVALVISVLVLFASLTNTDALFGGLYAVMFLAVGAILLMYNIEARRARLLQGALPWLGMLTGVAYLVVGLTEVAHYFTPVFADQAMVGLIVGTQLVATVPVVIEVNPRDVGQLLYIIWAIWLGVKLSQGSSVAPAPAR